MTNPSPAAQAILDAAINASHPLLAGMGARREQFARVVAPSVASIVRAVASQLREMYESEGYVDFPDDWLDDIATELDGTNSIIQEN